MSHPTTSVQHHGSFAREGCSVQKTVPRSAVHHYGIIAIFFTFNNGNFAVAHSCQCRYQLKIRTRNIAPPHKLLDNLLGV